MTIDGYREAFDRLPKEISAAEVNEERIEQTTLHIEGGEIARCASFDRTKLYVRATAGRTGMVYTEKVDEDASAVIARAAENARFSQAEPEAMHTSGGEWISQPREAADVSDMLRFGAEMEAAARGMPGVSGVIDCSIRDCSRSLRTRNSHGFDAGCASGYAQAELTVTVGRKEQPSFGSARVSQSQLSRFDPQAIAKAALEDAALYDGGGLAPVKVAGGVYDAVLTGRVMRNILMTAWLSLSGHAMRSGASPFGGQPGQRIGSDVFSLINAPSHPMLGQRFDVDSEGTRCVTTRLVDGGKLLTPLYTLSTGAESAMPSTGSAGRVARMTGDVPIALTTVPANLFVEPGQGTPQSLAARMQNGLLVTYSLDLFHSVNAASGDFSIPCGGVFYRAGEPVGTVSQMTMAGNLAGLWSAIEAVGGDLDFDEFYFLTYLVGSPSALVRGLTFAG